MLSIKIWIGEGSMVAAFRAQTQSSTCDPLHVQVKTYYSSCSKSMYFSTNDSSSRSMPPAYEFQTRGSQYQNLKCLYGSVKSFQKSNSYYTAATMDKVCSMNRNQKHTKLKAQVALL